MISVLMIVSIVCAALVATTHGTDLALNTAMYVSCAATAAWALGQRMRAAVRRDAYRNSCEPHYECGRHFDQEARWAEVHRQRDGSWRIVRISTDAEGVLCISEGDVETLAQRRVYPCPEGFQVGDIVDIHNGELTI